MSEKLVACPSCSGEGCEGHAIASDPEGRCDGGGEVTEKRRIEIIAWHNSDAYKERWHRRDLGLDDENDWDPMECD